MRNDRPEPSLKKTTTFAIVVNAVQILALLVFVLYVLFADLSGEGRHYLQWIAVIGGLMATWGAYIDILDAIRTRKSLRTISALKTTNEQMDSLNLKLRAQRHDFLNHIQVIYSLMEMEEYSEAEAYLEKLYSQLHSVQTVLRTKMAAFNALMQVKSAACGESGIAFEMDIRSALENVGIPPWELCCVIGNLLDNAMDACRNAGEPRITAAVREDLKGYTFTVSNNGAPVPHGMLERIFEPGVSTKGENRGMGLSIVRQTLAEYDGTIACESNEEQTSFIVSLPRGAAK